MKNQLIFVLGWVKYNRLMTIIYVIVLSMIACSSILLMQFFSDQSTYDQDGKFYYCYYFDKSIDNDIAEKILCDLYDSGIEPLEYEVAGHISGHDTGNEYTFCAYYVVDNEEQKLRNDNYDYGVFENERNTYISDSISSPLKFGKCEFQLKGEGAIVIGSCGCDYLITQDDYKEYVGKIDVIEVTLTKRCKRIDDIMKVYSNQYTEEKSTGILESGLESIRNTALVSLVLIVISFYSTLAFIEILIHLQKKDISVFYQCGASPREIRKLYVAEALLAGIISFSLGGLQAALLVKIVDFNFDVIRWWVYLLGFLIYNTCYYLEAIVYINMTLRYVGMISRESD